jgi:hypothetical protein
LWKHEKWPDPLKISFGKYLAAKMSPAQDLAQQTELAEQIDTFVEEDYKTNL